MSRLNGFVFNGMFFYYFLKSVKCQVPLNWPLSLNLETTEFLVIY